MKTLLRIAVLSTACLWGSAHAAIDYFLHIDDIDGESTSKGHEKWVDVDSFAWGVSNSGGSGVGGGGGSGKSTFAPFSWTQGLDRSTVPLFVEVAGGTHTPKVTFEAQTSGDRPYVFFRMAFENVLFTSLTLTGTSSIVVGGALAYDKITMTYWPQKKDGSRGDPVVGSWDVKGSHTFSGDPNALMGLFLARPTSFDAGMLNPVPEPQTWALMGLGLFALGVLRKRHAPA